MKPELFSVVRPALAAATLLALLSPAGRAPALAQAPEPSLAGAGARAEPDPFYTGLLRDGRTALLRGDAATAKHDLRLACFGFLEFPAVLAECRIRLGLAEGALGDRDAFTESFTRLEEIEERFHVYAAAAVSPEERTAFEARVLEWISPEILRTIPVFAPLIERGKTIDFAKLSPRERTKELERRAAANPKDQAPRLALAEEELARGRAKAALGRLEGVPDTAGDGAAGCLRGRAFAEEERCRDAVAPLGACEAVASDARLTELALGCLLELDRLAEAEALRARLAPAVAGRSEIKKQLSRLDEELRVAARKDEELRAAERKDEAKKNAKTSPVPAKSAGTTKAPPAKSGTEPLAPPATKPTKSTPKEAQPATAPREAAKAAAPKPSPDAEPKRPKVDPAAADQAAVSEARKAVQSAEKREDLETALERVQPVADRRPKDTTLQALVGELAYRASRWKTCADYLVRPSGRAPADPTLRFYLAVCQFESGDPKAAARTAGSGLEKLPRTPFVDQYLERILGDK